VTSYPVRSARRLDVETISRQRIGQATVEGALRKHMGEEPAERLRGVLGIGQ